MKPSFFSIPFSPEPTLQSKYLHHSPTCSMLCLTQGLMFLYVESSDPRDLPKGLHSHFPRMSLCKSHILPARLLWIAELWFADWSWNVRDNMTGCYSSWQSWPTHRDGTYVNIYPSLLNLNIDQPEQTHGWRCWDACVSVCQMTLSIFMADIKWKHKQIDFKCHSCLCQSLLLQLTKLCLIGLDLGPFCSHATQLWKTFNKSACCGAAGGL